MNTQSFIAIDFETANTSADSACAIAMAHIENMQIVNTFYSLIRPPSAYFTFTYIHGITWNDVKNALSFAEVWQYAKQHFLPEHYSFIAHNAPFDRKVLKACCMAGGQGVIQEPFYCTLKASRKFLSLPAYNLNYVAQHFNIPLDHHNALSDTLAAAQIFISFYNLGYNLSLALSKPSKPRKTRY